MTQNTIDLGRGFGPVSFGYDIKGAQEVLGPADERVEYEDGDIHLRYWRRGVHLFFPRANGNVLEGVEVERQSGAILLGVAAFELDRQSLINLLEIHYDGLQPTDFVVRRNDLGENELSVPRLLVSFFFNDDATISAVNWSHVKNNTGISEIFAARVGNAASSQLS